MGDQLFTEVVVEEGEQVSGGHVPVLLKHGDHGIPTLCHAAGRRSAARLQLQLQDGFWLRVGFWLHEENRALDLAAGEHLIQYRDAGLAHRELLRQARDLTAQLLGLILFLSTHHAHRFGVDEAHLIHRISSRRLPGWAMSGTVDVITWHAT